jgi:SAM-dependent methyltransferase
MRGQYFSDSYVEETRLGFLFLRSHTWQHHVLRVAINDLRSLFSEALPQDPVLLDAGCGQGKSFQYLQSAFSPTKILGIDADPLSLQLSAEEARRRGLNVELIGSDCAALQLPDASVDIGLLPPDLPSSGRAGTIPRRVLPCAQTRRLPAVRRIHRGLHRHVGDSLVLPSSHACPEKRGTIPGHAEQ